MRIGLVVLGGAAGLTLAGCSDGVDEAEQARIVSWLIDHDESPEAAACLAEELSNYQVSDFDALAAVSDNQGVDEVFSADVQAAFEVCKG